MFKNITSPYVSIQYASTPDAYSLFTFAARNQKPSKFSFFKSSHEDQLNRFMFNCFGNTWYTQGIEGFSQTFEETLVKLRELLALTKHNNSVFMGSSMGAYGSTLFGSLCNARRVIGFGTEIITNLAGGYSSQNLSHIDAASPFYRLDSLIGESQTMFDFFAGECSPVDIFGAAAANRYANSRVHVIANSGHAVVNDLKDLGMLQTIVDQGINRQKISFTQAYYASPVISDYLNSYDYVFNQEGYKRFASDYIEFYLKNKPNISPENYIALYAFLYKARYLEQALVLLDKYVERYGDNQDVQFRRVQAMFRQGRYLEVLKSHGAEGLAEAQYFRAVAAQKLSDIATCQSYLVKALDLATKAENKKLTLTIVDLQKSLMERDSTVLRSSIDKSSKTNEEVLVVDNKQSVASYVTAIQEARKSLKFETADALALEGLVTFPNNVLLQSEYAWNAQTQKNWTIAADRLLNLFALQGKHVAEKTYVRLAQAYRNLGHIVKADGLLAEGKVKFPDGIRIAKEYAAIAANELKSVVSKVDIVKSVTPKDILLTTYPEHASKNVGDQLITFSTVEMISTRNVEFKPIMTFRKESLDHYPDGTVRSIIAPGFSVSDNVYPSLFGLYSDLERMPDFYPIGCSFQHLVPSHDSFEKFQYSQETLNFLRFITKKSGALPCRDQLIVKLLNRYEIPAVYSGDLAIYDENKLNTIFTPPKIINSIVFTIQHQVRYETQSYALLELIKKRFPDKKLYVAFHSKAAPTSQIIADYAVGLGFEELHLYGDAKNLDIYDDIDLHIGYRLHGHISFLRRRKPSVLMIEDARSYGLAHTPGTDVGCFQALSLETLEAEPDAPAHAMAYVDEQIQSGFKDYHQVFAFIDKTYTEFVKPYFDVLAQKTH